MSMAAGRFLPARTHTYRERGRQKQEHKLHKGNGKFCAKSEVSSSKSIFVSLEVVEAHERTWKFWLTCLKVCKSQAQKLWSTASQPNCQPASQSDRLPVRAVVSYHNQATSDDSVRPRIHFTSSLFCWPRLTCFCSINNKAIAIAIAMAVCSYSYSYSYPYIVVSLPPSFSASSLCCLSKLSEVCQRYLRPICVHAIWVEKKTPSRLGACPYPTHCACDYIT